MAGWSRLPWTLVLLALVALCASWRLSRGLVEPQGVAEPVVPPAEAAHRSVVARVEELAAQPLEAQLAGTEAAQQPVEATPDNPRTTGASTALPASGCTPPRSAGEAAAAAAASAAPGSSAALRPRKGLAEELSGAKFAWCHDGYGKNGEFSLFGDGQTGGDFLQWNLRHWKAVSEYEIHVDDGSGDNVHRLVFNCQRVGFFVAGSGQRGFALGQGFASPDAAEAPTSEKAPDCSSGSASRLGADLEPGKMPVWVWWDFRGSVGDLAAVPVTFRLNLRTWKRHIPADNFSLHLVNSSNVRHFLPDLPEAFFRLYTAAKTDFLRAALIAAHGGVYLDGDILLVRDLDLVVKDLLEGRADIIPYEGPGDHCPRSYTTNFIAGTKGNRLSEKWIAITKEKMMNRCRLPETENHREPEKVCCYNSDWCPRGECHVAWGDISHPPPLKDFAPGEVRMSCIPFRSGFAHTMTGEELFRQFTSTAGAGNDGGCWRSRDAGSLDLECSKIGTLSDYFGRHGYHLYNMLHGAHKLPDSEEGVLASDTVAGELYRKSLGLERSAI